MSQRILITDDHDQSEIDLTDGHKTLTHITLARPGQGHLISWDNLNLSDASWDKLIKTIREFCPNAEPVTATDEIGRDLAIAAELAAPAAGDQAAPAAPAIPAATPVAPKPVAASTAAPAGNAKLVRAWWYALDAASLKALGLPTPDRSRNIGKLPALVNDAYDNAHG